MSGGTGYGITDQGFVMPQLTDIQSDINNALKAKLGADINTDAETILGQISGVMSDRLALIWQGLQDDYASQTPDTAFGASLDNVGALRGILRLGATPSVVQNVRLFGVAGTPIPATTTKFSVLNSPGSIFFLNNATTLVAGQSCIQTLTFSAVPVSGTFTITINGSSTGSIPFNANAATIQAAIRLLNFCSGCTVSSLSATSFQVNFLGAGTGGLMVQPQFGSTSTMVSSVPAPVSVITAITQAGVDQANVIVTCTQTGPIIANAGTLTVINTPISGLTGVLNTSDAAQGRNVESDSAYRSRMNQELQVAGAATVEAIRSKLLQVAGVISVLVYENIDDVPDGDGRPPHCFEAVINGGTDSDIANEIWVTKAAGIKSYGDVSFTITDSQGQTHVIKFSRPTIVDIYMAVSLTVNISYPSDGDTLVKEALANYVNGLGQGQDIIVVPQLVAQLVSIPGIDDAVILVSTSPGPTLPNNIVIEAFEQAATETDFISVTTTPG